MGSQERSKKKAHLWKRAIFHFLLCFTVGFFTGFAPTNKPSIFSSKLTMSFDSSYSPQPVEVFHQPENRSLLDETTQNITIKKRDDDEKIKDTSTSRTRRLVIVVTPTSSKNILLNKVLLRRLASTLRLVDQPLLWIVVEHRDRSDESEVSEILRRTGIMYRHVVYKENFTDPKHEMDHQRTVALNHIEHHKLSGIVHFAGLSNVYDLRFFQEIRAIEGFGTWPIAKLSANKNKAMIEGPVCESSQVMGWHVKRNVETEFIHISGFAFNSSILWDPERWGRTTSAQDTSQNSLKYVREEVLEEETKLKGIPSEDCSKVLLWSLRISH